MSGNDKHGTVHGATLAIDRHGQINKAYSFDGVNDKIVISGAEESTPGEITVTAWVKIQSTSGEQMIVRKGDVSKWWALHYYNSALTWSFDDDSAKRVAQSTISPSEDWMFVVGIRKPGVSNQIFVNGNIANSTTDNNQLVSIPSDLTIGGQNNIRFYDGPIDDIRIYDRALSAAEVFALYNLEKPKIPLTDSNFQTAVNLWFSDEANATATYGHISDWNVSAVTDMSEAFNDRTDFNEDIGTGM